MNIHQKLIEVRKSAPYLQKANKGEQYNYVSSSQTLSALKSKMDELSLLLVPRVIGKEVREYTVKKAPDKYGNEKQTTTYFTELILEYTWINAEDPNETITCPWYGQGVDIAGEKGVGKALTYAEKYFMLKFFNIPTDKDDPDAHQKKQEDNGNDSGKQLEAYDKIIAGIDWFEANGKPLDAMMKWYSEDKKALALKAQLDADNLSKANKYYSQMVDVMQEKKAA
jgi:hypothetical protein